MSPIIQFLGRPSGPCKLRPRGMPPRSRDRSERVRETRVGTGPSGLAMLRRGLAGGLDPVDGGGETTHCPLRLTLGESCGAPIHAIHWASGRGGAPGRAHQPNSPRALAERQRAGTTSQARGAPAAGYRREDSDKPSHEPKCVARPNARVKRRPDVNQCERSELPKTGRQLQRFLSWPVRGSRPPAPAERRARRVVSRGRTAPAGSARTARSSRSTARDGAPYPP